MVLPGAMVTAAGTPTMPRASSKQVRVASPVLLPGQREVMPPSAGFIFAWFAWSCAAKAAVLIQRTHLSGAGACECVNFDTSSAACRNAGWCIVAASAQCDDKTRTGGLSATWHSAKACPPPPRKSWPRRIPLLTSRIRISVFWSKARFLSMHLYYKRMPPCGQTRRAVACAATHLHVSVRQTATLIHVYTRTACVRPVVPCEACECLPTEPCQDSSSGKWCKVDQYAKCSDRAYYYSIPPYYFSREVCRK